MLAALQTRSQTDNRNGASEANWFQPVASRVVVACRGAMTFHLSPLFRSSSAHLPSASSQTPITSHQPSPSPQTPSTSTMSVRPTTSLLHSLRPARLVAPRVLTPRLAPSSSSLPLPPLRRSFATSHTRPTAAAPQDPYTSKASEDPTVQEKVDELKKALSSIQVSPGMTRGGGRSE